MRFCGCRIVRKLSERRAPERAICLSMAEQRPTRNPTSGHWHHCNRLCEERHRPVRSQGHRVNDQISIFSAISIASSTSLPR